MFYPPNTCSNSLKGFRYSFTAIFAFIFLFSFLSLTGFAKSNKKSTWVGTWSTAPQLVEINNMPPAPGLSGSTLRQVVKVSIGGKSLRMKFSNEFSNSPVTMKAVQIAVSMGGGVIDGSTITELKFNGKTDVVLPAGLAITSDPVAFDLEPRMELAITIFFGQVPSDVTGHPGSRTTSYLHAGNKISEADFAGAVLTDHWYIINGIDVLAKKSVGAVAILGNSITDGRGSGTNKQNRWPDILSERLLKNKGTQNVGVLNLGIGGNCVLKNCLGPSGLDRFERDVINQHGVRWLIILEGINDLGQAPNSEAAARVAKDLIAAYERMIDQAHAKGIRVYGATILPFNKSFYYTDYREAARNTVNEWVRNSGRFDAVIDFDKAMRDPQDTITILPDVHTGDFLHPNEAGYQRMGESIDLELFK